MINYALFEDDTGFNTGEFGDLFQSNAGIEDYNFDQLLGGMIGTFGTYSSDLLTSIGPYSNPGICTCSDTFLSAKKI